METSDPLQPSSEYHLQAQGSLTDWTIGKNPALRQLLSWARENSVESPLLLLLDASHCDVFPNFTGTALAFLRQHTTLDCLLEWEVELPLLSALLALGDACAVSPYVATAYPPMPPEHPVARQLQGGELGQLPLIALIARPIPKTNPVNDHWLTTLRTWCFIQFLRAIHNGGLPPTYLITVVNKLRQAIDEESDWLDLFIRLQGPTKSFNTLTRHLSGKAASLLSDAVAPIERPSHRSMLAHLRSFCDGRNPDNTSTLVTLGRIGNSTA